MNDKAKIALEVGAIAATIGVVLFLVHKNSAGIMSPPSPNESDTILTVPDNFQTYTEAPNYFTIAWPKIVTDPSDPTGQTGLQSGTVAPGILASTMPVIPANQQPTSFTARVAGNNTSIGGNTYNVLEAGGSGGGCCDSCNSSMSIDSGKLLAGAKSAIDAYNNNINGLSKTYADNILSAFPADIRQFVNNTSGMQLSEAAMAKLGSGNI